MDIEHSESRHEVNLLGLTDAPEAPLQLSPIPQEERETQDVAGPSWQNLNPIVNALADAQGVEVGSRLWRDCGMEPYSGSSGEHRGSYGWNFKHLLTERYRRGVLANYGHRRAYYLNAPYRQFGYDQAGRPHGWAPESPGDTPKGPVVYQTSGGPVTVSGPDAEHFWLTPLFALVDDQSPIDVPIGGADGDVVPSNIVARWMASLLVSSAVGTVRDRDGDGTEPYPWTYGDRAIGRLLHTMIEGARRGLLLPHDVPTAVQFITRVFLPFYERAPGMHSFGRALPGKFPISMFNGFYWLVPVCYDAYDVLSKIPGGGPLAARFKSLLARWAQWAIDMREVAPGRWFNTYKLHLNDGFVTGTDEWPHGSIRPFIKPDDFQQGSSDFTPWAFRCVDVLATIANHAGLKADSKDIRLRYVDNLAQKKWLVNADGSYAKV